MAKTYLIPQGSVLVEQTGVADPTVADAGKIPVLSTGGRISDAAMAREPIVTSAGATDAGKLVYLDGSGKFSVTVNPTGFGNFSKAVMAGEDIGSGKLINLYDDSGTLKARLADSSLGYSVDGYSTTSVTAGNTVNIFNEGIITGHLVAPGVPLFLSTAGGISTAAPTVDGEMLQVVGRGLGSALGVLFLTETPIIIDVV